VISFYAVKYIINEYELHFYAVFSFPIDSG